MQVAFYFAGKIIQVLDAIPRVRCASGNVWHIRFTFANTFANTFAYFAEFECKTNCEHTYPLSPGPPETTLWQRVKLGIEAGVSKVGEAENLDGFRLFRACCLSGTDVCPPLESALKESSSFHHLAHLIRKWAGICFSSTCLLFIVRGMRLCNKC